MKMTGPPHRQIARFNVDDPEDLAKLTKSGAIWNTPYAQRALDAISSGAIDVADCKNIPANIKAVITQAHG